MGRSVGKKRVGLMIRGQSAGKKRVGLNGWSVGKKSVGLKVKVKVFKYAK